MIKGDGDLRFTEGQFIPVSFANWDGNNAEVGSRHTLTTWYWLLLPPEIRQARWFYGAPIVTVCGILPAGPHGGAEVNVEKPRAKLNPE